MKIVSAVLILAVLLAVPGTAALAGSAPANTAVIYPTFVIKAVDRNDLVTIRTDNLRLNDTYVVTMGLMGTRGVNGYVVAKVSTTTSGTLTKTFSIPAALRGQDKIAIRLQSPTTGYYAYNWFYNSNANLSLIGTPEPVPVTPPPPPPPVVWSYPYFNIKAVDKATSVTIKEYSFPPNTTFIVRMNWMFTQGVAGQIIETVTTNANGKLSNTTYAIPDFLQDATKIAIRLESPSTGYFAFNWFYNNDAP
jgi:hypothetical protein